MKHIPVLTEEVLTLLDPQPGDCLLDGTVGLGGHARAYLERAGERSSVVGLDADPKALQQARQNLTEFGDRVVLINRNFGNLLSPPVKGFGRFAHALLDLGIGSHQLDDETRGFSFKSNAPLKMRFGGTGDPLPASFLEPVNALTEWLGHEPEADELIKELLEDDLVEVIRAYGEEKYAGRIAHAIKKQLPQSSQELAKTIQGIVPKSYQTGRIHPATRTFQALRLAVNRELEVLDKALGDMPKVLKQDGICVVISFHSLEEKIVKKAFKNKKRWEGITKQPVKATQEEITKNPRARSSKIRAARLINKQKSNQNDTQTAKRNTETSETPTKAQNFI